MRPFSRPTIMLLAGLLFATFAVHNARSADSKQADPAAANLSNSGEEADRLRAQGQQGSERGTPGAPPPTLENKLVAQSVTWQTVLTALLAGGIFGHLVTTFGGAWLTERREHNRWLTVERQKVFSELLTIATYIPKSPDELGKWTYCIRDASQRLHILFKGGTAPPDLAASVETVFQLARSKKDRTEGPDWDQGFREAVRAMRTSMAAHLQA